MKCGPPATPVEEYADRTNSEYNTLLSSDPSECEVQAFLEKHPSIVPGALTPSGSSGHYPLHCSLIAQPKLPGIDVYIPDFMWLAVHSGAWFPTLIEIERPGKRIFRNQGDMPNASFTQARHQLEEWRTWFDQSDNKQNFMRYYGIPHRWQNLPMYPYMILVYGRQSEFQGNLKLERKRSALLPNHDMELMSFDRLRVNLSMHNAITVRAMGEGRYEARWIPSVFQLRPSLAKRLLYIDGIPEAISENSAICETRKEFLKQRAVYWKSWASSQDISIINSGDAE